MREGDDLASQLIVYIYLNIYSIEITLGLNISVASVNSTEIAPVSI